MTHIVAVVTTYVHVALGTIASKMVCVTTPGKPENMLYVNHNS